MYVCVTQQARLQHALWYELSSCLCLLPSVEFERSLRLVRGILLMMTFSEISFGEGKIHYSRMDILLYYLFSSECELR